MKTLSTLTSVSFCPGLRSIYLRDLITDFLFSLLEYLFGSGIIEFMVKTSSGLVPQVTCGSIFDASIKSVFSYFAPGSLLSFSQYFTAMSQSSPLGVSGLP